MADQLIAVLLRGRAEAEREAVAEAARIAGGTPREVIVLLVRPLVWCGLIAPCGIDPERLRREVEMEQRRTVRAIFEEVGAPGDYAVASVGRPAFRSAVRAAIGRGCSTIVVPHSELRRGRPGVPRRGGIEIVRVGRSKRFGG